MNDTRCSFCGTLPRHDHPRLGVVVGPGVNICQDCVILCAVILAEQGPAVRRCPYCGVGFEGERFAEHLIGPLKTRCDELTHGVP